MDDARQLRNRQVEAARALDQKGDSTGGTDPILVTIIASTSTIRAAFKATEVIPTCVESEGSIPTFATVGVVIYVINIGSVAPPNGSTHIATTHNGLYIIQYDG